jgi:hypothetical protein
MANISISGQFSAVMALLKTAAQFIRVWSPHLVEQRSGVDHLWPRLIERSDPQKLHGSRQLL